MLTLLCGLSWAGDDTFFAGPGPGRLSMAALQDGGTVRGRTGLLVARVDDPVAIAALPEVAGVHPLRGRLVRIALRGGVDDLAFARALHGREGVHWVHPDLRLALVPHAVPDDPWYAQQWHLDNTGQGGRIADVDINAPEAWTVATGAGVTIAVIDTGVQLDHPDLLVIPGHDYVDHDEDPSPGADDGAPHGTGVAGIAAAIGDNGYGVSGVAWASDVYAIRLIGGDTSTSDLYEAFAEAVDAGAGVLSNSWGFYGCQGVPAAEVFSEMFAYAEDEGRGGLGSVVVFAAGNDNCDNSGDAMLSNNKALVVAALEWWDQRASYSNYGRPLGLAAPTTLLTTDLTSGGYGNYGGDDGFWEGFSGTSGATPVVSGVVALMLEANPRLTAKQVRSVLADTAAKVDVQNGAWDQDGWSPYYGYGRIDAGAAVAAVAATAPAAPTPILVRDAAYADRVILAWEPAVDPDGDVQFTTVRWWLDGVDSLLATEFDTRDHHVDLEGKVAVGDVVHWQVAAEDTWGLGAWSPVQNVAVVEEPLVVAEQGDGDARPAEEPAGCATGRGGFGLGGAAVIAIALLCRRAGG